MLRIRSIGRVRSGVLVAAALAVALLLTIGAIALAGSPVSITTSGQQFAFQPNHLTVHVGDSVTWTNNTDAPHTVSSDSASGPLNGSVSPQGTYRATFTTAGDFAYHCNIHSYMHGSVHVAALPPTDTTTASTTDNSVLVGLAALGSLLVVTGFGLRLRRREERA